MSFACLFKLWFLSWKCLHTNMVLQLGFLHPFSGYLVVYWKWFLLVLNIVLYKTSILLSMWNTRWNNYFRENSYMFFKFVDSLKVNVVVTWLQHRVLQFPKHGELFPGFKVLLFIFFTMLFWILLLLMSSLRFLLCLKAGNGFL